jgi:hypothetical protein
MLRSSLRGWDGRAMNGRPSSGSRGLLVIGSAARSKVDAISAFWQCNSQCAGQDILEQFEVKSTNETGCAGRRDDQKPNRQNSHDAWMTFTHSAKSSTWFCSGRPLGRLMAPTPVCALTQDKLERFFTSMTLLGIVLHRSQCTHDINRVSLSSELLELWIIGTHEDIVFLRRFGQIS